MLFGNGPIVHGLIKLREEYIWNHLLHTGHLFKNPPKDLEQRTAKKMTKLDLVEKAINFAMNDLCGSHLDMPCGCDGCPYGNVRRDDDGNPDCRGFVLDQFIEKYADDLEGD